MLLSDPTRDSLRLFATVKYRFYGGFRGSEQIHDCLPAHATFHSCNKILLTFDPHAELHSTNVTSATIALKGNILIILILFRFELIGPRSYVIAMLFEE